jgi:hypothetical protein
VSWEIEFTAQAEEWLERLDDDSFSRIAPGIDKLGETGPTLGRPTVDRVKASRHHNMKELRSTGGHIRILFAFDPDRKAILLIGGEKTGQWKEWYRQNIPLADALYGEHLEKRS